MPLFDEFCAGQWVGVMSYGMDWADRTKILHENYKDGARRRSQSKEGSEVKPCTRIFF